MDICAVIGANFGDEGKGVITDALAYRRPDSVVVMTNGGAQRGHSVVHPLSGRKHSFHHFGSGTFRGCATYFPSTFILNPMQFVKEYWTLVDKYGVGNIVTVRHKKCIFSTPFDMILNQDIEKWRKRKKEGYGTCGMGIWETIVRCQLAPQTNPYASMSLFNIAPYEDKIALLQKIRDEYCPQRYKRLTGEDWEPGDWVMSEGLISHYIDDVAFMCSVCREEDEAYSYLVKKSNLIFENGQGLLLDDEYGICDSIYATPSKTGMRNVAKIVKELIGTYGVNIRRLDAYYVSRPYRTIHGPKRVYRGGVGMAYTDSSETNKGNEFQGEFRKSDIDQHFQADTIRKDMATYLSPIKASMKTGILAYTHLDQSSPQLLLLSDIAECGSDKGADGVMGLKW